MKNQVWMAENLNYADSVTTPSLVGKNWCYGNKVENCDVAGRLYTWTAAIDSVALYDGGNGVVCGYGMACTLPARRLKSCVRFRIWASRFRLMTSGRGTVRFLT